MKRLTLLFWRTGLIALLCLVLFAATVTPVRADVAPPPPPEGANIQPGGQSATQVSMQAETVLIDVQPGTLNDPARAIVTANFQMRNLGTADETMDVYFPLNVLYPGYQTDLNNCPYPFTGLEINDFKASVDSKPAKVNILRKLIKDDMGVRPDRNVNCWASFAVTFPASTEVKIDVSYSVNGYFYRRVPGSVQFPYVLMTGSGWQGNIGSAEITFRAPFPLNQQTLLEYQPQDGQVQVQGNEIRWKMQDFEPQYNVTASIVNPYLWKRVTGEQEAVNKDPKDGEAWGRMGRWYKEIIKEDRGFREDDAAEALYGLSKAAYQKALALKPQDAEWHAAYADLVCWNAGWIQFGTREQQRDDLVTCANEVRLALSISPNLPKAQELLKMLTHWEEYMIAPTPVMGQKNGRPDYLLLTTTPTARPPLSTSTPVPTRTPTAQPTIAGSTGITATDTPASVAQAPVETVTATIIAKKATPAVADITPTQKPKGGPARGCPAALLPAIVAAAWALKRRIVG